MLLPLVANAEAIGYKYIAISLIRIKRLGVGHWFIEAVSFTGAVVSY